jgi:hypothetical protein
MKSKNPAAVALGKLGKGIPKTPSAKMIRQRKKAAKRPRPNARGPRKKV